MSDDSAGEVVDLDGEERAVLRAECSELLERLENTLAAIESAATDERRRDALRSAHTLKGLAASAGAREMAASAHGLEDLVAQLEGDGAHGDPGVMSDIHVVLGKLHRLAASLEEVLDGAAAPPTGNAPFLVQRLERVVREGSIEAGNAADLRVAAWHPAMDRVANALVQLVRNAVAHGVEPVEERIAAGKPGRGTIAIEAVADGDQVRVIVRDDGRGIPRATATGRAVDQEPGEPDAGEPHGEYQAGLEYVFTPGVTTAPGLSVLAGRGMGMDVVRTTAESRGGSARVHSSPGRGTTVEIRLPLETQSDKPIDLPVRGHEASA